MAEIPDFAPGPWCQISPLDNEMQPAISLGSLQSWDTASKVGVRKTIPSLNTEEPPGARRGRQEPGSEHGAAELLSSFQRQAACQPYLCP